VPAAGPWMDGVKVLLSAAMFAVAWMFFCQVYPDARRMPWWALLVTGALMLGVVFVKRLRVRWMPLLWAVLGAQCVGWLLFAQPLSGHEGPSAPLVWRVKHDEAVVFARAQKKPMMIDFTAQWCQACQELDHRTFTDEAVRKEGVRFVALKVDATTMDDAVEALFQKYGVLGLPAVVFVDSSGNVLEKPRVTGFVSAEEYVLMMRDVQ
jgi:thiol:disulfide interchange protein DsbD